MENFFHVLITEGGWGMEPDTNSYKALHKAASQVVTLLEEFGPLPLILYIMFG